MRLCTDATRLLEMQQQPAPSGRDLPVADQAITAMAHGKFGGKHLEATMFGVALPLLDAIRTCRHFAPTHGPHEVYALIGREDLARQPGIRSAPITLAPTTLPYESPVEDPDGMQALILKSGLRFSRDSRLNEVSS